MSTSGTCDNLIDPSNSEVLGCVFGYSPNVGAAVVFLIIFIILLFLHSFLAIRSRYLLSGFIVAAVVGEIVGFIARLALIDNFTQNGFLAMTIALVVAPNILAVFNYNLLKRIILVAIGKEWTDADTEGGCIRQLSNPFLADGRLSPNFVNRLFSLLVIIAAIMQVSAISDLTSSNPSTVTSAEHLLAGGLGIILFTYICFFGIAFHVFTDPSYNINMGNTSLAMRRVFTCMFITMLLLTVRTTYRLIEYAIGADGWVGQQEFLFYICDSLMIFFIFINMAIFNVGRSMAEAEKDMESQSKSAVPTQEVTIV